MSLFFVNSQITHAGPTASAGSISKNILLQENASNSLLCVAPGYPRSVSQGSTGSQKSELALLLQVMDQNVVKSRTTSQPAPIRAIGATDLSIPLKPPVTTTRKSSQEPDKHSLACMINNGPLRRETQLVASSESSNADCGPAASASMESPPIKSPHGSSQRLGTREPEDETTDTCVNEVSHSLRQWFSTLRRKNLLFEDTMCPPSERWSFDECTRSAGAASFEPNPTQTRGHKKSESWTSSTFVTAIKSAASRNVPNLHIPLPPRKTRNPSQRRSTRDSRQSNRFGRTSPYQCLPRSHLLEAAAMDRAVQRRKTLEELASSEQIYIAALQILVEVTLHHIHWTVALADQRT